MIHFPLHAKLFVAVRIQNKCVALNHLAYLNAPESFTPGSQMQELSWDTQPRIRVISLSLGLCPCFCWVRCQPIRGHPMTNSPIRGKSWRGDVMTSANISFISLLFVGRSSEAQLTVPAWNLVSPNWLTKFIISGFNSPANIVICQTSASW